MAVPVYAQGANGAQLVAHLRGVYDGWRKAMVRKDARSWQRFTSNTKKIKIRNRLWSDRKVFPNAVFEAPLAPPDISPLTLVAAQAKGRTAKLTYFGKVDLGIGGKPTENLFVISYEQEGAVWKYHGGEFVNLSALPEVRKQIAAGNKKFLEGKDFVPSGVVETPPAVVRAPVKYVAKAYVFCPGREVKLLVNKTSRHLFQNTKRADVVIGGAKDGINELQFTVKDIPGGNPNAPITIRMYLMSEVKGQKPPKPIEYQIDEEQAKKGMKPKTSGTLTFNLDQEMAKKLGGR